MPVMDGVEATRRIRALDGGRDVKIAALSASVLADERERALATGVDDFVSKPLQFDEITRLHGAAPRRAVRRRRPGPSRRPGRQRTWTGRRSRRCRRRFATELADAVVSLDAARIASTVIGRVADV